MTGERDLDRAHTLMMAALDGDLGADEQREFDARLAADASLAAEFARLRRVQEVTSMMTLKQPSDEVWDGYWQSTLRRTERRLGWLLVLAGGFVLLGWSAWQFVQNLLADTDTPMPIRLAILAVALGVLVLAFSVLREKLFTKRHDPYDREVLR